MSSRRESAASTTLDGLDRAARGAVLELLQAVLVPFVMAATLLASPPSLVMAGPLSKGPVFLVLGATRENAASAPPVACSPDTRPCGPFLGGWLDQFAVVKPHRAGRDRPPTLQMFVLVAPLKGNIGIHVVGSF